jgi:hypothetical protein
MICIIAESDNHMAYRYLKSCHRKLPFHNSFKNKFYKHTIYNYPPFFCYANYSKILLKSKKAKRQENVIKPVKDET